MTDQDAFNAALGRRIRARRHELQLTQLQLAERCERRGNSWVVGIESGATQLTTWQLSGLATALETSPEALLRTSAPSPARAVRDVALGGPVHPAVASLRAGLWLPTTALLTVWPGVISNPKDLPIPRAVSIARKAPSAVTGTKAWLLVEGATCRYLPRPRHWRQLAELDVLDKAHEVLLLLPG